MPTEANRALSGLPHALDPREGILPRLRGRRPALFLDYDGTLSPIAARPELAMLAPDVRAALANTAAAYPTGVVSGRGLSDLRERVGLDGLYYAGNHGFEIAGPGLEWKVGTEYLAEVTAAHAALAEALDGIPGVIIENKRYSLSVHYRLTPPGQVPTVRHVAEAVVHAFPRLRPRDGKQVLEVRPALDWHKGKAVRWLLEKIGGGVVPVYVGDDLTDEDAFAEIAADGLGILVSEAPRATAAGFWLRDVGEVHRLLAELDSLRLLR